MESISGDVLLTGAAMQVLQAKSAAATTVEKDAVIHSQLHHPNIIGFKKVRTRAGINQCVTSVSESGRTVTQEHCPTALGTLLLPTATCT